MSRWHPIETAPKDGRLVILGNHHGSWVGKYLDRYQSGFKPQNPWASMMLNTRHLPHDASLIPTHWIPMPELIMGAETDE